MTKKNFVRGEFIFENDMSLDTLKSKNLIGTDANGKLIEGTETASFGITLQCEDNTLIATGEKQVYLAMPYDCTITGWRLTGNTVGSIVIDVWKKNSDIPTVADTITGTEKPTLDDEQIAADTNLTSWTTDVTAGDIIAFNVESVTDLSAAVLTIMVTK